MQSRYYHHNKLSALRPPHKTLIIQKHIVYSEKLSHTSVMKSHVKGECSNSTSSNSSKSISKISIVQPTAKKLFIPNLFIFISQLFIHLQHAQCCYSYSSLYGLHILVSFQYWLLPCSELMTLLPLCMIATERAACCCCCWEVAAVFPLPLESLPLVLRAVFPAMRLPRFVILDAMEGKGTFAATDAGSRRPKRLTCCCCCCCWWSGTADCDLVA